MKPCSLCSFVLPLKKWPPGNCSGRYSTSYFPVVVLLAGAVLLVACGKEEPVMPLTPGQTAFPMESILQGARVYQEHCAQCHGPDAQGHPDWRLPQVTAAP
ncbi:MAG: c-type cytochrome, partial [Pseudomonadota bacterium]